MFTKENGYQAKGCMNGQDFQIWVATMLEQLGFETFNKGSNDNGVDIIAVYEKIPDKSLIFNIQCKYYNRPVGKNAVQEVFTGTSYYKNNGKPVVITNNAMTACAKVYAKTLGVEVIDEIQLEELQQLYQRKVIINDKRTGLMGLIIAIMTNRQELLEKAVSYYTENAKRIPEITDKEKLKIELSSAFDEAQLLLDESSELQKKAKDCQKKALELQRQALLRNLDCP